MPMDLKNPLASNANNIGLMQQIEKESHLCWKSRSGVPPVNPFGSRTALSRTVFSGLGSVCSNEPPVELPPMPTTIRGPEGGCGLCGMSDSLMLRRRLPGANEQILLCRLCSTGNVRMKALTPAAPTPVDLPPGSAGGLSRSASVGGLSRRSRRSPSQAGSGVAQILRLEA
eukprot:TRINITY_DN9227_c0_g1_i1.p1 TRINITY_DN9227_c0_g1~~TRINITY_DN9227_c0_g1_i1.p1  ORF type:complete len:171 (+),score=19.08 TRINITY_DN9227_c0_g1_i1:79-591(+)